MPCTALKASDNIMDLEAELIHLSNTLRTVESLESVLRAVEVSESAGIQLNTETVHFIEEAVSFFYQSNGKEKTPTLNISTESLAFHLDEHYAYEVTKESLSFRVEELSTEATYTINKILNNLSGYFSKRLNQVQSTKKTLVSLGNKLKGKTEWRKPHDITLKHSGAISLGGRANAVAVATNLKNLSDNLLSDGKLVNLYISQFNHYFKEMEKLGAVHFAQKEFTPARIKASNFTLPSPFKEVNTNDKYYRLFTFNISDGIKVEARTPNGQGYIIPKEMVFHYKPIDKTTINTIAPNDIQKTIQLLVDAINQLPSDKEIQQEIEKAKKVILESKKISWDIGTMEDIYKDNEKYEASKKVKDFYNSNPILLVLLFPTMYLPVIMHLKGTEKLASKRALLEAKMGEYFLHSYKNFYDIVNNISKTMITYIEKSHL